MERERAEAGIEDRPALSKLLGEHDVPTRDPERVLRLETVWAGVRSSRLPFGGCVTWRVLSSRIYLPSETARTGSVPGPELSLVLGRMG